ncbi:hypothetical protein BaRGS_00001815, partial [Batillaria attramentaria]
LVPSFRRTSKYERNHIVDGVASFFASLLHPPLHLGSHQSQGTLLHTASVCRAPPRGKYGTRRDHYSRREDHPLICRLCDTAKQ